MLASGREVVGLARTTATSAADPPADHFTPIPVPILGNEGGIVDADRADPTAPCTGDRLPPW